MDIVASGMDLMRRPSDERGCLTDRPCHPRQGQCAEQDQHNADAKLHGKADSRWDDHTEENDRAADGQDCQCVSEPPYRADHGRTPQILLAGHDSGNGDDVVRLGGVPDAEEKPQKEQRHQIAERFGHNRFTGEFSTPRGAALSVEIDQPHQQRR
jgi:hypothetical protein